MVVWETSKDEINHLNKILELQRSMIEILIKNNNYLYEQLDMQKDNSKQHTEYEKLLGIDKLPTTINWPTTILSPSDFKKFFFMGKGKKEDEES